MLILHTSDWHLGRSLHRADLTPAFEVWCNYVVDLVEEREIDAVLISGDVYDRSVPPTKAVSLFDATLARLAKLTTVILTSGNHDSAQRLGFGASLMQEKIHIRTDSRKCGIPVSIQGKDGNQALIYPIPYLDPDVERRRLAHDPEDPESYLERSHEAVLSAALALVKDSIERDPGPEGKPPARICMAHAFVSGAAAFDSERDIRVGGTDSVPSDLFRLGSTGTDSGPLSYVALGHLHSAQKVGASAGPLMRYSGSPIAFSFSENRAKSSVLLEITGSHVHTELLPAPVWKPVVTLEGTLDDILLEPHTGSFVRCIVTDKSRPRDMATRIRQVFPFALDIQHAVSPSLTPLQPAEISQEDPFELVAQFLAASGNATLSEGEKLILQSVVERSQSQFYEAGGK